MSEWCVIRPEQRKPHQKALSLLVRRGFRDSYRVTARCARPGATNGQLPVVRPSRRCGSSIKLNSEDGAVTTV
jgi:hypothetical protein